MLSSTRKWARGLSAIGTFFVATIPVWQTPLERSAIRLAPSRSAALTPEAAIEHQITAVATRFVAPLRRIAIHPSPEAPRRPKRPAPGREARALDLDRRNSRIQFGVLESIAPARNGTPSGLHGTKPIAGRFLYYPGRRQQSAAVSTLIDTLRLSNDDTSSP